MLHNPIPSGEIKPVSMSSERNQGCWFYAHSSSAPWATLNTVLRENRMHARECVAVTCY
jgi:hypothetical protein